MLQNMHEDYCGGEDHPGLCEEMDPYNGELLRQYLLDVKFRGNRQIHLTRHSFSA